MDQDKSYDSDKGYGWVGIEMTGMLSVVHSKGTGHLASIIFFTFSAFTAILSTASILTGSHYILNLNFFRE